MDVIRENIEAVRQISIQLFGLQLPQSAINKMARETIFFLYEGGESQKWSYERPHSAAARALHRQALAGRVRFSSATFPVTYDHAIPLNAINDDMRMATETPEKMSHFLSRYVQGVVILKEENATLSRFKLRSRLPLGARQDDLLARYRAAGIKFEPEDEAKLRRGTPA